MHLDLIPSKHSIPKVSTKSLRTRLVLPRVSDVLSDFHPLVKSTDKRLNHWEIAMPFGDKDIVSLTERKPQLALLK